MLLSCRMACGLRPPLTQCRCKEVEHTGSSHHDGCWTFSPCLAWRSTLEAAAMCRTLNSISGNNLAYFSYFGNILLTLDHRVKLWQQSIASKILLLKRWSFDILPRLTRLGEISLNHGTWLNSVSLCRMRTTNATTTHVCQNYHHPFAESVYWNDHCSSVRSTEIKAKTETISACAKILGGIRSASRSAILKPKRNSSYAPKILNNTQHSRADLTSLSQDFCAVDGLKPVGIVRNVLNSEGQLIVGKHCAVVTHKSTLILVRQSNRN